MGEIRSPCFSLGQNYFGDNSDRIHSPYFSYGGEDYHGDNAEIHPPYSSAGDYAEIHPPYSSAGDYRGDNAEIHAPYSSAGDYLVDNTEIHSEALFHQHISGNSYNGQDFVKHGKVPRHVRAALNHEQESDFWKDRVSKEREREGAEDEFWDALVDDENNIRQCYEDGSHEIKKSEDFLELILYDAVFIFELFLKYNEDGEVFKKDSILKEPGLSQ
uniref:Uncharacterized protein n=1 Tax=Populus alba TaxID=43335 RepID=A0A4U5NAR0_POPAL|nr:hypothetical protein D5086_0000271720 [Populus alba]